MGDYDFEDIVGEAVDRAFESDRAARRDYEHTDHPGRPGPDRGELILKGIAKYTALVVGAAGAVLGSIIGFEGGLENGGSVGALAGIVLGIVVGAFACGGFAYVTITLAAVVLGMAGFLVTIGLRPALIGGVIGGVGGGLIGAFSGGSERMLLYAKWGAIICATIAVLNRWLKKQ